MFHMIINKYLQKFCLFEINIYFLFGSQSFFHAFIFLSSHVSRILFVHRKFAECILIRCVLCNVLWTKFLILLISWCFCIFLKSHLIANTPKILIVLSMLFIIVVVSLLITCLFGHILFVSDAFNCDSIWCVSMYVLHLLSTAFYQL